VGGDVGGICGRVVDGERMRDFRYSSMGLSATVYSTVLLKQVVRMGDGQNWLRILSSGSS